MKYSQEFKSQLEHQFNIAIHQNYTSHYAQKVSSKVIKRIVACFAMDWTFPISESA